MTTMLILSAQARQAKAREKTAHAGLVAHAQASFARLGRIRAAKNSLLFEFKYAAARLQEAFRIRQLKRQHAALRIQDTFHARHERRQFARMRVSAIRVQASVRRHQTRQKFVDMVREKERMIRQARAAYRRPSM